MKVKMIIISVVFSYSSLFPNPIATIIVKEGVKKIVPKISPIVMPIVTTLMSSMSELVAEDINEVSMSPKILNLYKTKL